MDYTGDSVELEQADGTLVTTEIAKLSPRDREYANQWWQRVRSLAPGLRVWNDSSGRQQINAMLLDCWNGQVELKREDGFTFCIEAKRLSQADQDYADSFSQVVR